MKIIGADERVTKSLLGSAHYSCSRTHTRCSPERRITAAPRLR